MSVTRTANKYNLCNATSVQIREYARRLVSTISVYYVFTSQAAQTKGIAREHTEWKCLLTKKTPKTLNYDQFAFPKTKIMSQKTLKYKLATIKLADSNSLWYIYYGECFDLKRKIHFKGKYKHATEPRLCFIAIIIKCLLDRSVLFLPHTNNESILIF